MADAGLQAPNISVPPPPPAQSDPQVPQQPEQPTSQPVNEDNKWNI